MIILLLRIFRALKLFRKLYWLVTVKKEGIFRSLTVTWIEWKPAFYNRFYFTSISIKSNHWVQPLKWVLYRQLVDMHIKMQWWSDWCIVKIIISDSFTLSLFFPLTEAHLYTYTAIIVTLMYTSDIVKSQVPFITVTLFGWVIICYMKIVTKQQTPPPHHHHNTKLLCLYACVSVMSSLVHKLLLRLQTVIINKMLTIFHTIRKGSDDSSKLAMFRRSVLWLWNDCAS